MTPRYVAIANPDGLRWHAYASDLTRFWDEAGIAPEIIVVPWEAVVPRDGNLDGLEAFDRPAIVRLESPGRDWDVSRLLLHAGSRALGQPADNWLSLEYSKGRQVRPGLLHEGFRAVLRGLRRSFDARPHLLPTACPLAIAEMFDKNATCAKLAAVGVPVPETWAEPPDSGSDLLRRLEWDTTYAKLNTGSSASAIAVVRKTADGFTATSSLVRHEGHWHSSRRLATYRDGIADLLGFLIEEGVCVQRGIRMAQIDGSNFDVRVVVIRGEPAFTIFRLSHLPMTNLHLGGRRGDPARCRAAIPTRAWLDGVDACVEAASLFDSAICGVDLLFEAGSMRPHILEANAFGDWFPGLCDERGRSVHVAEIEATARANGLL